jgi:hypothetical protein
MDGANVPTFVWAKVGKSSESGDKYSGDSEIFKQKKGEKAIQLTVNSTDAKNYETDTLPFIYGNTVIYHKLKYVGGTLTPPGKAIYRIGADGKEEQLVSNGYTNEVKDMYGDKFVYTYSASVSGKTTYYLYLYDLTDKKGTKIAEGSVQSGIVMYGDNVAWITMEQEPGKPAVPVLNRYSISSQVKSVVVKSDLLKSPLSIYEKEVVWPKYTVDPATNKVTSTDIYMINLP